ncbi:MAG: cupredoxin domain-containing protein [Vulcanimicrobiaceae bacterium]
MRTLLALAVLAACAACTPGSFAATGGGGAVVPSGGTVQAIDVDLTRDPQGATPAGAGGGYAPLVTMVAAGTFVRFTNSDGFAHTATSISGSTFPSAYPFTSAALNQSGGTLSGGFSSGSLAAGTSSQALLADKPGTYIFGCFYHYGTPMRATIVVH